MGLGPFDVHPALVVTLAMVLVVLAVFVGLRLKGRRRPGRLEAMARSAGWLGSAPDELRDALNRIRGRRRWTARRVMTAPLTWGGAYLFQFEATEGFQRTSSSSSGVACLVPGRTASRTPVYAIGQFPPAPLRSLGAAKPGLCDGVGGPAFRERYYVIAPDRAGDPDGQQGELEAVVVSPALEEELLSWQGPTPEGLPDGWSSIVIRDRMIMVVWNGEQDLSTQARQGLLARGEKLSRILA